MMKPVPFHPTPLYVQPRKPRASLEHRRREEQDIGQSKSNHTSSNTTNRYSATVVMVQPNLASCATQNSINTNKLLYIDKLNK